MSKRTFSLGRILRLIILPLLVSVGICGMISAFNTKPALHQSSGDDDNVSALSIKLNSIDASIAALNEEIANLEATIRNLNAHPNSRSHQTQIKSAFADLASLRSNETALEQQRTSTANSLSSGEASQIKPAVSVTPSFSSQNYREFLLLGIVWLSHCRALEDQTRESEFVVESEDYSRGML